MSDQVIPIVARLRTGDGNEATRDCTFTADEWRRLGKFVERRAGYKRRAIFSGKRHQVFKFITDGITINSAEGLTDFLNGFEYHRDEEKAAQFWARHNDSEPMMEFSKATYIVMVLDQARAVVDIGNAIASLHAVWSRSVFIDLRILRPSTNASAL